MNRDIVTGRVVTCIGGIDPKPWQVVMKLRLILLSSIVMVVAGCATPAPPGPTIADVFTARLTECNGILTMEKLFAQVGAPTEKMKTDKGEIWVYKYTKVITQTHYDPGNKGLLYGPLRDPSSTTSETILSLRVTITFGTNGVMTEGSWRGDNGMYDNRSINPFLTITP